MKVVILAGGPGVRIREVSDNLPKVMLPVDGKPFLEYIVSNLTAQGLRNIILSVGYKSQIIEDYFRCGSWLGANIEYSREERPLGTGGALIKALDLIPDSSFLAMNGDSYFDVVFSRLIQFHKIKRALCTIYLINQKDKKRYGSVFLDGNSKITEFKEKVVESDNQKHYISAGIYCLEKAIFADYPPDKYISVEETIFPRLASAGRMYGIIGKETFIDIGIPDAYYSAEQILKNK